MLKRFTTLLNQKTTLVFIFLLTAVWQIFLFFRLRNLVWTQGFIENFFMSKGLIIYKDFVDTYPPIYKLLLWPIHSIFNYDLRITIYLSLLINLAIIILLCIFTKRYLKPWAGIFALLFFALWNSYILPLNLLEPEAMIGFLLLVSCFLFLKWLENKQAKIAFVLGLILALVISVKQITLLPVIAFAGIMFVYEKRSLKWLLAGIILPYIPVFIWFAMKGALRDAFFWNILHYLGGYYPYSERGRETRDVINFAILSTPIFTALIWLVKKGFRQKKVDKKLAVVTLPAAALLPAIWFSVFFPNRFLSILPISSLLFGWILETLSDKIKNTNERVLISVLVLVLLIPQAWRITTEIVPAYIENIKKKQEVEIYNQHLPGSPEYEIAQWFKENTPEDTKILVFGDAMLYFDAQRLPANNRVYALPWLYRPLPEFEKLLQEKPPVYWLVDERLFERFEQLGDAEMAEFIKNHLDQSYQREAAREDYWVIRERKFDSI